MTASVLVKTLASMHNNCRNRTLSIVFYEADNAKQNKRVETRKEFDDNLPKMYYVAKVSTNTKTLAVMRKESGDDRTQDHMVSQILNFDFNELLKSGVENYVLHTYMEFSPFAPKKGTIVENGELKRYEECLKSEMSFYVDLFKLMGDTVSLVIKSRDGLFFGHYVCGKVFIVDSNEWSLTVKSADFYSLNQYLPDYEIVDFVQYPIRMNIARYVKSLHQICEQGGLNYIEK